MTLRTCLVALVFWLSLTPLSAQELVVLTDTGQKREGLPVLTIHPDQEQILGSLQRGLTARVVRLFALTQGYLAARRGAATQPAYLYLSENQGGFPRYGFYLDDEPKPEAAYVDLHKSGALTGEWGAIDQIFPHELGHVFIRQLIGELEGGFSNQIHAIGLRTDRATGFNEGFAEHFQITALDDPEAPPETAALRDDVEAMSRVQRMLAAYRRELEALWAPGAPTRLRFLFWFSRSEDVLRYYGVKENLFAKAPEVSDWMLNNRVYEAYLTEAILPGDASGPFKSPGRLVSSEGVVSYFFYRFATHPETQTMKAPDSVYAAFGVVPDQLSPIENAYLKLFYVFGESRPQNVLDVADAYALTFPDEASAVKAIMHETLGGQAPPTGPEIWLANQDFQTGTTLFDQFRSAPRIHTFDLNSASLVDLMGIPGMSPKLARAILAGGPYSGLAQLTALEEMTPEVFSRFEAMDKRMTELKNEDPEGSADLSLESILRPYIIRAVTILLVTLLLSALAYRLVRRVSWWRLALNGLAATGPFLVLVWIFLGSVDVKAFLPLVLFGGMAVLIQAVRARAVEPVLRVLAAWLAAAVPAWLVVQPWF